MWITALLLVGAMYTVNSQTIKPSDLVYAVSLYPPYSFEENGTLKGLNIELIERLWKEMGLSVTQEKIKVYPWARAYKTTLDEKNCVLLGCARTPERVAEFKWLITNEQDKVIIVTRTDGSMKIVTVDEARVHTIGVLNDDVAEKALLSLKFDKAKLTKVPDDKLLLSMLDMKRIDMVAVTQSWFDSYLKSNPAQVSKYSVACSVFNIDGGFAFNKNIPDETVKPFLDGFEKMKKNKALEEIAAKYFH